MAVGVAYEPGSRDRSCIHHTRSSLTPKQALGCVPAVDGYLKAMQDVCHEHGILFALDEVMCGMGRTGSLHAYKKHPGVKPDVLLLGKGLAAGYAPLSAMLVSEAIYTAIKEGSGAFMHGYTFQNLGTSAIIGLVASIPTLTDFCGKAISVTKTIRENQI